MSNPRSLRWREVFVYRGVEFLIFQVVAGLGNTETRLYCSSGV